jgi:hypothetical protein
MVPVVRRPLLEAVNICVGTELCCKKNVKFSITIFIRERALNECYST